MVSRNCLRSLTRRVDSLRRRRGRRGVVVEEAAGAQLKFRNHTEARTWGGCETVPVPAYWRVAASTSSLDIVVVSTTLHFDMNRE